MAKLNEEADGEDEDRDEVDELRRDENQEGPMVLRADARVYPGTVVVEPLHALLAHVAVIAPRQSHNATFKANLVRGEVTQQVSLSDRLVLLDEAGTTLPHDKARDCQDDE